MKKKKPKQLHPLVTYKFNLKFARFQCAKCLKWGMFGTPLRCGCGSSTSKFKNKKIIVNGVQFDSIGEGLRYSELAWAEDKLIILHLRIKTKYPLLVNGIEVCHYEDDFSYMITNLAYLDQRTIEDYKGRRTAIFNLKKKMFEAQYGQLIYLVRA